jgi:hypothetical protein
MAPRPCGEPPRPPPRLAAPSTPRQLPVAASAALCSGCKAPTSGSSPLAPHLLTLMPLEPLAAPAAPHSKLPPHHPTPSHPPPAPRQAFEEMRRRPCPPDAIVYAAIIDALWDTGLSWAQRRAVALYKQAAQVSVCVCVSVCWAGGGRAHVPGGMGEWGRGTRGLGAHAGLHGTDAARGWAAPGGMEGGAGAGRISSRGVGTAPRVDRARLAGPLPRRAGCAEPAGPFSPCHPPPQEGLNRSHSHECGGSWELNLHSTTAGVALLSLHCWLHELQ